MISRIGSVWQTVINEYIAVVVIFLFFLFYLMKKKKLSLDEESKIFKDSDFVQEWDRACLDTYVSWSWDIVCHKWYVWKYFVIFLIMFWIGIVVGLLDWIISAVRWWSIFGYVVGMILGIWLLWFSINVANWLMQKIWDFFHEITWDRIWKIFCVTVMICVIMFIPSGLFTQFILQLVSDSSANLLFLGFWIVLFAIWFFVCTRLGFAQYVVVDKWYWLWESLIYSRNITRWHFWEILLFGLYFLAINILWMLCILVWLVWTVPMTLASTAKYYNILSGLYENWLTIRKE